LRIHVPMVVFSWSMVSMVLLFFSWGWFLGFQSKQKAFLAPLSHHLKLVAEGKPSMPPSWIKCPTSLTSHMPQLTTYNSKGSLEHSPLGNMSMLANFV
jgi:hypothetical protein